MQKLRREVWTKRLPDVVGLLDRSEEILTVKVNKEVQYNNYWLFQQVAEVLRPQGFIIEENTRIQTMRTSLKSIGPIKIMITHH